MEQIKRGPVPKFNFEEYEIGRELVIEPIKQSSFKSTLSKFNKPLLPANRHKYKYEQYKRVILATRIS